MGGSVKDVQSKLELDNLLRTGAPVVLHFWATWCEASKHMDQVFSHLSTDFPYAHILRVEAEEQPVISEAHSVSAVPYFVFFKDGKATDTLEGADPSSLANKVAKVAGAVNHGEPAAPTSLGMVAGPTILEAVKEFAKENGSPEEPKCGFSQKVVEVLKEEKVKFGSFDILSDNEACEGLKRFSNWPTFPQLYCNGELLGGCDIAIAMHESGKLQEVFKDNEIDNLTSEEAKVTDPLNVSGGMTESTGLSATLTSQLESLVNSSPVVLFMKGKPDEIEVWLQQG
ncbi:Monothiol glutaredoxin-related [Quillaja saponaria]|uniref:Monothiol glutaredoxin-related n=1 Tax=Quillaja saponaria TaxID=32244 RepID=A0AAD7P9A3_QUISA|nr:Monothiol glutaredoxin-related [Quillaja saponaria]